MRFIFSLIFSLSVGLCFGQTLSGVVYDQNGEALPFVNIYVEGTSLGTSTNSAGHFSLRLTKGVHKVSFRFVGYKLHSEEIEIKEENIVKDVLLSKQDVILNEVQIGSEDPAYRIIRKAIERRKFHLKQVESYSCDAYVKGMHRVKDAPDKILGQKLNIKTAADSNSTGIMYLSESVSRLYYQKPNKFKEKIISSKVSGKEQAFTWNSAQDFYFNFYENKLEVEGITERAFVSPLAENAFMFYKYKLLGMRFENGLTINKIQVIPRRKNDPVFSGILNIVEDEWNIHSLELTLTKNNGVNYIDTLLITQYFVPVKENIWMPIQQRFDAEISILGIKSDGYYLGIFSNYDVNIGFEKKFFTNEIIKIEEGANERDSLYWIEARPMPLTAIEVTDYVQKDSLKKIKDLKLESDTADKGKNGFEATDLIFGYSYRNRNKKLQISVNPLISAVSYNTVEGVSLKLTPSISKKFENENALNTQFGIRYGTHNTRLSGYFATKYRFKRVRKQHIQVGFGKYPFQFHDNISGLVNTGYTLFARQNHLKLYERLYGNVSFKRELTNGFDLRLGVGFSRRYPLMNTSDFSIKKQKGDETFTRNELPLDAVEPYEMPKHNALNFSISLKYKPGLKYMTRPDKKVNLGSKYPVLQLKYKKSIRTSFSDLNYDFLEFSIHDDMKFGLFGVSTYDVSVGGFINNNRVEAPDYKHFSGNRTIFGRQYEDGFHLLPYYNYSTKEWFTEAHYEHHFNGFIFNKVPGFRKLRFQAVGGFHFLYTPALKDYYEVNVGIENILKIIRVDFVTGFNRELKDTEFGFRVGLKLGDAN